MGKKNFLILLFFIFTTNLFAQEYWSNKKDGPTNINSAKKIFKGRKLDQIEGIWFEDGLGTVAIFKENNIFKMYIVEGDTDFNGTWEATIYKRENLKYNYIGRIWYTRTDGYEFDTQNANIEIDGSSNSFFIRYERLSNDGVNMDGKFTRVWPNNIFAYNNNQDKTKVSSNSGTSSLKAVEEKKIENSDKRLELYDTLNWKNFDNPKTHIANIPSANANLDILENEIYLDNWDDINQFYWWTWGYGADKSIVAYIRGEGYTIFVDYIGDGYVKLDDWKNVDSNNLMSEMREIAKLNEEYSKQNNLSYATQVDWIYEPTLNEEKKVVSYSYKVKWSNDTITMESTSLKLGKKGYISTAYVTNVKNITDFAAEAKASKEFAEFITFDEGLRHSDYKSGDKVAAVGIGGLVAGTLGVKALAKAGTFAKLLPLLLKFGWILLIPLAFVGKLFGGKSQPSSSPDEKFETKTRKIRKKKK